MVRVSNTGSSQYAAATISTETVIFRVTESQSIPFTYMKEKQFSVLDICIHSHWDEAEMVVISAFLGFMKVAPQKFILKGGICRFKKTKTIGSRHLDFGFYLTWWKTFSSLVLHVDLWCLFCREQHEGQSELFSYVKIKSKYIVVSTDYWKEGVNQNVLCNNLATCFSTFFLNAKKQVLNWLKKNTIYEKYPNFIDS